MVAHLTEDLRDDLLALWSESHRRHHTVHHLHEMLDAIAVLADEGIQFDRSAELARQLLASSPIREEVAFKPARAQVLTSLLAGSIFHTGPGRDRWEEHARRNVADEIQALTG
jgi:predicted metal-dependent HD superfamily phosphohydrolase